MQNKLKLLKNKLVAHDKLAIAFSGGVDSTFLLLCAREVLGENALAVTIAAPNFAPDEIAEAKDFCVKEDIPHLVINADDTFLSSFAHNPTNRCYLCKKIAFSQMCDALTGVPIADGTNADDAMDYRPGRLALKELGIISPLEEVGFTKAEIRQALKAMNIKTWNKPAYACLASRIPYGEEITKEKLSAIFSLESYLRKMGFSQVRVRHHGNIARIEVLPEERERLCKADLMDSINLLAKESGFLYATLDLGGYVMGNLNTIIDA